MHPFCLHLQERVPITHSNNCRPFSPCANYSDHSFLASIVSCPAERDLEERSKLQTFMAGSSNKRTSNVGYRQRTRSSLVLDAQLARGRFSFIYKESYQKEIPVKHCFPLPGIRGICRSAVEALVKEFGVDESGMVGYSGAGGLKLVAKIPEEELSLVRDHFLSQGVNITDATAKAFREGIEWYGVVDGAHVHTALLSLQEVRPDTFLDFNWYVTVINWHPLPILQAFGRARNLLQSGHVVEMTLFDTIQALQDIAKEKARISGDSLEDLLRRRGAIKEISDEFCGGSRYSKQTTRTLTGAALRVKPEAMRTLGKIMNESDAELAKKVWERCNYGSTECPMSDDRAYRHIISTNTLRAATTFLNAEAPDQCNALERLKSSFEANGLKCFQASRLNKETERSQKAHHQVMFMNEMMGTDTWPESMLDVRKKLLLSSVFDRELDEEDLSTSDILQSLVSLYKSKMPLEAGIRWSLYCQERNTSNVELSRSQQSGNSESMQSNDENSVSASEHDHDVETIEEQQDCCPLDALGVKCLNMTLEDFSVRRSAEEDKFHLVLGDPSQLHLNGTCKNQIDMHQADKIVGILKSLTRPHGWSFIYTRAVDYHMWDKGFRANGFEPLDFAWPMVRNCDTIQTNTSAIPQSVTELMIGARRMHHGRPEIQPDTTSCYERNVCTRKRKFAIIDSCPEPIMKLKKRNSRELVRKNERSPDAVAEFVKTFCPENGNVLDAFAGTMETAKACFLTSRFCTALEADRVCFDLALERLKESATRYLDSAGNAQGTYEKRIESYDSNENDAIIMQTPEEGNSTSSLENATLCEQCPSTSDSDPETVDTRKQCAQV